MPPRRSKYYDVIAQDSWVRDLDDPCLKESVLQALLARGTAQDRKADLVAVARGDKSIDAIRLGLVQGEDAWRRAAYALRTYVEASTKAYLAGRKGHALRRGSRGVLRARASGRPAVLLLHTAAAPERAARLHDATCPMLRTAKRGGVIKRIEATADVIDDLNERGYQVKSCKCMRALIGHDIERVK